MTMPIRFIYFDLGNVLVQFDPQQGCERLAGWLGVAAQDVRRVVWESGLQDEFEHGRISPPDFATRILIALDCNDVDLQPSGQPLLDFLSDMFTPLNQTLELVGDLQRQQIRFGILSNTCCAHWDWILRQPWDLPCRESVANILSFEVGAMKPQGRIYQVAQAAANVPPESIFFTDDRSENVAAATALGWQTHCFSDAFGLRNALRDRGVLQA